MPPRRSRHRPRISPRAADATRSPIARVVAPVALADEDEWAVVSRETLAEAAVDRLHEVAPEIEDALGAERLGSQIPALWWQPGVGRRRRQEIEEDVGALIADGLEELGDHAALCGLRALGLSGGGEALVGPARGAAERLRERGVPEPVWWARVHELRPTGARRTTMRALPGDVMLIVQFDRPGEPGHTLVASIRAARGGTMGLIETGPSLAELDAALGRVDGTDAPRGVLEPDGPEDVDGPEGVDGPADRRDAFATASAPIDPAEAGALIRRAIRRTDALGTAGPVEDYVFGRGLAARRAALLCGEE